MRKAFAHLFTPRTSNNHKAKVLHLSSLSVFILLIMFSQIVLSFVGQAIPGVLGIASNITAEELISLTNQQRRDNGLPALKLNTTLVNAASQKAADMIAKNYWAHTSPDGVTPWVFFKNANYQYLYAGENLARDFMDSQSVVNAWMKSPTHKDNILSDRYKEIGIAVVHGDFQGQPTTLVVQMFGAPINLPVPKLGKIDQSAEAAEAVIAELVLEEPVMELKSKFSLLSSFNLTKAMSISLTLILLLVIVIDTLIVTKKKIIRISGKGLAHLLFLGILLIILLGIQPGLIL